MEFSFDAVSHYLFKEWTTGTLTGLILCCALGGILAFLLEGLKALIAHLDVPKKQSWKTCYNFRRSLFALLQLFLGYILMLLVMTYNAWVAISILLGSVLGYYLFGWTHSYGNLKTKLPDDNRQSESVRTNVVMKMNGYWHVPSLDHEDEETKDRETTI